MKEFHLANIVGTYPATRYSCDKLFDNINKSRDNNIIIDFSAVSGITHSFAAQYIYNKKNTGKKIIERNENDNVIKMFNIIGKARKIYKMDDITVEEFRL